MSTIDCPSRKLDFGYSLTVEVKTQNGSFNKLNWLKIDEKLEPKVESFYESEGEGFETNVRTGTALEIDLECLFDMAYTSITDLDNMKLDIGEKAPLTIKITDNFAGKTIEDYCIITKWSAPREPSVTRKLTFSLKYCGKPKGIKILKAISDLNTINDEITEATTNQAPTNETTPDTESVI